MRLQLVSAILIMIVVCGCVNQPAEQSPEEYNASEMNDITEEVEMVDNVSIVDETIPPRERASSLCVILCQQELEKGTDLSSGPCLSQGNEMWNVDDWVCDVAHAPRQGIDEFSANQCTAFRANQAHHFVEVDESCKVISVY